MTEDTGWGPPPSDEAPATGLPDPHVDKDSPAATGASVEELEAERDRQFAELRELILEQNKTIGQLRQQVNGQQVSVAAPGRKIPDEDHGGCTHCSFLSLNETPNGEDGQGNATPLAAAESPLQHVVFALAHAADTGHGVYAKFGERLFPLSRGA